MLAGEFCEVLQDNHSFSAYFISCIGHNISVLWLCSRRGALKERRKILCR
jgi:hypothetical protein